MQRQWRCAICRTLPVQHAQHTCVTHGGQDAHCLGPIQSQGFRSTLRCLSIIVWLYRPHLRFRLKSRSNTLTTMPPKGNKVRKVSSGRASAEIKSENTEKPAPPTSQETKPVTTTEPTTYQLKVHHPLILREPIFLRIKSNCNNISKIFQIQYVT